MKIILLCGNKSNQHALAAKIAVQFNLVGIVKEERKEKKIVQAGDLLSKILNRFLFYKIASSWYNLLSYYEKNYQEPKQVSNLLTGAINSQEVLDFIKQVQPDLIMVSGTSLIKTGILELKPSKGIINLHTGLSPYVKGGPNCTNWCIANNTLHLIGNTIMWIDKGIDSGNIITSAIVPLDGTESLDTLHFKVMEHAHQLYLDALHALQYDFENCSSVKQQDIATGSLFLTKMWNFNAKLNFMLHLIGLKKRIRMAQGSERQRSLKLISLPKSRSGSDTNDGN
jgi:methionyl-tRNA formyltransferase